LQLKQLLLWFPYSFFIQQDDLIRFQFLSKVQISIIYKINKRVCEKSLSHQLDIYYSGLHKTQDNIHKNIVLVLNIFENL